MGFCQRWWPIIECQWWCETFRCMLKYTRFGCLREVHCTFRCFWVCTTFAFWGDAPLFDFCRDSPFSDVHWNVQYSFWTPVEMHHTQILLLVHHFTVDVCGDAPFLDGLLRSTGFDVYCDASHIRVNNRGGAPLKDASDCRQSLTLGIQVMLLLCWCSACGATFLNIFPGATICHGAH